MILDDPRPWWRKLAVAIAMPRVTIAGLRFARTGSQRDYWRHEYYLRGSKGIADIIIHKDELIFSYSKQLYTYRRTRAYPPPFEYYE